MGWKIVRWVKGYYNKLQIMMRIKENEKCKKQKKSRKSNKITKVIRINEYKE